MRRAVLDTQRSGLGPDLLDIRHHDCGGDDRVVDTELKPWKSRNALRPTKPRFGGACCFGRYHHAMPDEANAFELDLNGFDERYLKTCAMSRVTPVSRERADGLVQESSEVLARRPEPTKQ